VFNQLGHGLEDLAVALLVKIRRIHQLRHSIKAAAVQHQPAKDGLLGFNTMRKGTLARGLLSARVRIPLKILVRISSIQVFVEIFRVFSVEWHALWCIRGMLAQYSRSRAKAEIRPQRQKISSPHWLSAGVRRFDTACDEGEPQSALSS